MTQNLYITTMEPQSGKSLIALGVMELLSRRVKELGFFRPVVGADVDRDNDLELIRSRYCPQREYDSLFGATHETARRLSAGGAADELLKKVFERYKALEQACEFVVCEGTDYTGIASAFEFDFNAQVANHLGCALLLVTNGRRKTPDEVVNVAQAAREAFREEGCTIAATMVNRVEPGRLPEIQEHLDSVWPQDSPVFVLPEERALGSPTVSEIAGALGGRPVHEVAQGVDREVLSCKIAAMHLSNYLEYVEESCLVITPGDRADVILGSLATLYSDSYPNIAGILLTGGMEPSAPVNRLVEGIRRPPVPIYVVDDDTYTAAMKVNSVRGVIAPGSDRKIATALGVFEASVDTSKLEERIVVARSKRITPMMFEYDLVERAKSKRRRIVLAEGHEERILRATEILLRRGVVDITLVGNEAAIRELGQELGLDLAAAEVADPANSPWQREFAEAYFEMRKHKGITKEFARDVMHDPNYFSTMMVHQGKAHGMVSGAIHTTAHTIRPAFEIIRTRPGCSIVSSVFLMCLQDRVLVYGDCAVNPNPNPQQLADIAASSADTAAMFGIEPRVAMLSYSTGDSGQGADVDKVRQATELVRQRRPDIKVEGPIQYDAAIDAGVARTKMPDSEVAGRATVFVFPDLDTGNNTYKAVQRSAGAVAVGPILQGLNKPVNDLSRGCTIPDIVNTVAITAIQGD